MGRNWGRWRALVAFAVFFMLTFSFQNCSKGFVSTTSVSSQCAPKLQLQQFKSLAAANLINCDLESNFACQSRIFKPDVQGGERLEKVCATINGKVFCAPLKVLLFDTRNISGAFPEQFAPGGDYNREDIDCGFYANDEGLLRVEADSAREALEGVVEKCHASLERGEP